MTTPDWMALHAGAVRMAKDNQSAGVYFAGQLQYVLVPLPAEGKHTCRVSETINGKRVDGGKTYPTAAEAIRGGLEELRAYLGW